MALRGLQKPAYFFATNKGVNSSDLRETLTPVFGFQTNINGSTSGGGNKQNENGF